MEEEGDEGLQQNSRQHNKDLLTVLARICDPVTGVASPLNSAAVSNNTKNAKKKGKDKEKEKDKEKIVTTFTGRDLVSWILENTKATNRQQACQIAQALITNGFLSDPELELSKINDDETIFKVVKEKREDIKGVFKSSPTKSGATKSVFTGKTGRSISSSMIPTGLFGCDLTELTTREKREIPSFLVSMITYLDTDEALDTEGIFRIAPNAIELSRLKDILDGLEGPIDFSHFNFKTPHLVTGLLKAWLRQLRTPLAHPFESFITITEQVIPQKRINICRQLVEKLPKEYASSLDYLIGFLHRVTTHSENNKMGCRNLASVVGPNVLRRASQSPLSLLKDMNGANEIVTLFIAEYPAIFANVTFMDDYKADLLGLDALYPRTCLDTYIPTTASAVIVPNIHWDMEDPPPPSTVPPPPPQQAILQQQQQQQQQQQRHNENPKQFNRKSSMLLSKTEVQVQKPVEKRPQILSSSFEGVKVSELLVQMTSLSGGVKIKNRKHHLKTYRNVASGTRMVEWLVKKYGWRREKCVEILQQIMECGYIQANPPLTNFKEGSFYIFYIDELLPVPEKEEVVPPIVRPRVRSPLTSPRNNNVIHEGENDAEKLEQNDVLTKLSPREKSISDKTQETDKSYPPTLLRQNTERGKMTKILNPTLSLGTKVGGLRPTNRPHLTSRLERGRSEGIVKRRKFLGTTHKNEPVKNDPAPTVLFDEESEIDFKQILLQLMDTNTLSGWVVVGYLGQNTLHMQATGDGDVDTLVQELKDDEVQYALVRLSYMEADVLHIRNVFINWVGPNVLPFEKGKKRTHSGKVSMMFRPFHAELTAISKQNFTRERVLTLTGTHGTHVID